MVLALIAEVALENARNLQVTPEETGQASFFGYIGIACALVFASKTRGLIDGRPGRRLRNGEERRGHREHGRAEA